MNLQSVKSNLTRIYALPFVKISVDNMANEVAFVLSMSGHISLRKSVT